MAGRPSSLWHDSTVSRLGSGALLCLSGAAALIYQILWIKQLSLVVGVDVYAITTAVSAFFAGLALGSAVLGRRAEIARRPLRLYAGLEVATAIIAVAATVALAHSASLFATLERHAGAIAWLLPFLIVGTPAFVMGGTLPAILKAQPVESGAASQAGGVLYAANTVGAILGSLLAPFALIPALGVTGAALAAACLNLVAAGVALAMGSSFDRLRTNGEPMGSSFDRLRADAEVGAALAVSTSNRQPDPSASRPDSRRRRRRPLVVPKSTFPVDPRLALRLYAVAGGIALGYEVVWSQAIVQFTSTRVFAFSIVLATYLAGLAIGSFVYVRLEARVRDPWNAFGLLVAAAGLVALIGVAGLGPWLMAWQSAVERSLREATHNELLAMCGRFAVAALGVVFVPTLLLGAAFPAALRLAVDERRRARDLGTVLALNTAGGIAGTLLTGFVLIPTVGIVRSLGLLALGAAAVGLIAVFRSVDNRNARTAAAVCAACAIAVAAATPADTLARLLTASRSGGDVVYYDESAGGTVAVVEQHGGAGTFRRLYIQGVSNSGDAMTSIRYMRLQALLPLVIHRGEPRAALVIGLGTGITAGSLLNYAGLQHRVCAELLPAVVAATPLFHNNLGRPVDPRLEIRVRDGRRELLRSIDEYDLITLEPPPPSAAGVVNLYSRDFYELARRRLRPNGLLAQWWPLATQNDEDSRALVRSLLDVFPYASLWTTELHEMLLVGSAEPMELDATRMTQRFAEPTVAGALAEVGIGSPSALAATWVTDRAGLERYAGTAAPVTDDRPGIEYATWTRPGEFSRVLTALLALRTDPPVVNTDSAFLTGVTLERSRLLRFYDAGLSALTGDRQHAVDVLRQVLAEDDRNPYYRWMAGLPPL